MSVERVLAGGLFALSAALFLRQAPWAIRLWQTYTGTGGRRQEDATGRAPEPGHDALGRIAMLAALGYRTIGDTRTRLPVGERYCRILAAHDRGSYAIVDSSEPNSGLIGLYTAWPDGTWAGTLHPDGDPHEGPGLRLQLVTGTLGDAVTAHRSAVDRLRPAHGDPCPVEGMADMLALDVEYRRRFGGRELRLPVVRALLPTAIALLVSVWSLYLFATLG